MQNNIKKIVLILIVIALGIFFGYKFYQNSKNTLTNISDPTNTDRNRTPFQTRDGTSTDINTAIDQPNPPTVNNPIQDSQQKSRLVQLWKDPVSGFGFVYKDINLVSTSTDNSTSTVIKDIQKSTILKNQQFIYLWDRKTGRIYENMASTTDLNMISNYTLIGAEEAYFIDNSSVITRKLQDDNETIKTSFLKLAKDFSTSTTYSTAEKNINIPVGNISLSLPEKKIFYFSKGTGKGMLSSIDGSVKSNIITTTLSEWLPQYVNKSLIALTTKPSAYFKGYLFFLNTNGTGKNDYILGEKYGFNTLISPDGKKVIYSEIINDTLETFIYDVKSKTSTYLTQSTIVDKCTWSKDSKTVYCGIPQKLYQAPYPDAWYNNDTSFSDNIWSINALTGKFSLVIALQDLVLSPIDVYKISVSDDGKYMLFQDKISLTLWKYNLVI
jgi:hypothetical protein